MGVSREEALHTSKFAVCLHTPFHLPRFQSVNDSVAMSSESVIDQQSMVTAANVEEALRQRLQAKDVVNLPVADLSTCCYF